MALGIRQQLRLEARVNELTDLFYSVKADRDLLIRAVRNLRVKCRDDFKITLRSFAEIAAVDPTQVSNWTAEPIVVAPDFID